METRHRAVIVEDERLARLELCSLLSKEPTIEIVGEASSVQEARAVLQSLKPDVIFLDVQLGADTGFDLLDSTPCDFDIVFVTAFNHHAVRAFEINALDYLLKPVDPDRLREAVQRIGFPRAPHTAPSEQLTTDDRLFVRIDHRWRFVRVSEITCIEARGDFSRVHLTDGMNLLINRTLKNWERQLPTKAFLRIHRSTIVNLDYVQRVEEWSGQTFQVFVRGLPDALTMSRRYAARLKT